MKVLYLLGAAAMLFAFNLPLRGNAVELDSPRQVISFNGDWFFQRDGAKSNEWKAVEVPASFEQHEGSDFNGVGWYRREVAPITLSAGKRALVHFQAAATAAEVWWNGQKLGTHLAGRLPEALPDLGIRCRLRGEERWTDLAPRATYSSGRIQVHVSFPQFRRWSPAEPNLYELEIRMPGPEGDRITTRAAFRTVDIFGPQLRLNGQPIQVRGLLNWGYSAPLTAPNPGESTWRRELEFARAHGFNLMKFCLWMPPKRYLELADEMGMFT